MAKDDSDFILFQLLTKAAVSADDAILIKKYLSSVIQESIQTAVSRIQFPEHDCPIPPELSAPALQSIVKVYEAVGDGDLAHGIERARDNHRFMTKMRKVQGRVGMAIATSFVVMVVTGIGMAVWTYLKAGAK